MTTFISHLIYYSFFGIKYRLYIYYKLNIVFHPRYNDWIVLLWITNEIIIIVKHWNAIFISKTILSSKPRPKLEIMQLEIMHAISSKRFTFYFETHYFPHPEMINYNICMSLDNKFDQKNLEHCVHGEMSS